MSKGTVTTETERTDRVRNQGREHGLFRACMDQIRSSHTIGQTLRHAALTAGLLTDANCYAELLGQFYVATAALEKRMEELLHCSDKSRPSSSSHDDKNDSKLLVAKVQSLGYSFRNGYESDLRALLGPDWKTTIHSLTTEPTKRYAKILETANDAECAAAAFILHGPLIIGGGAMLQPRVQKAFGTDATHVFASVIGTVRGGRSARRREFIRLYDTLLDDDEKMQTGTDKESEGASSRDNDNASDDSRFQAIVQLCGEFMQLNNEMMLAVRKRPWWYSYVAAMGVATSSALIWRLLPSK